MPRSLGSNDRNLLKDAVEIIGVDEVGRGCLAGPVVVCAAAFREIPANPLIQDSKVLTAKRRAEAADWVVRHSKGWLVTEVWIEVIDRIVTHIEAGGGDDPFEPRGPPPRASNGHPPAVH